MEDDNDVQLALLNFRNTVGEGYSASPAQLLFGRRRRTLLPIQRSRLIPKLATDVYHDKKIAKNAQIEQYIKSAHHLNPLAPGDAIRMKLPGQDTWTLGACSKKLCNRSYVVLVQEHTYRRNRRHLRLVYDNFPLPDCEPWEMRANPLPLEAGPMSPTTPRVTTERTANANTGYTTATCGLDTSAQRQRHTYQETTSVLGRLSVKQITFLM
ncbi:hypothetical protein NP493_1205g00014 [Ridgeia piscesae]|uniref:Uncharacterized protein n=1 Tax=Ridgeia piscesae TaxID=27915 RepID=A0AAD9KDE4_RIDPI|nr:hypothetical protein NP493_1205g00014 [Ridgeia piscesae]